MLQEATFLDYQPSLCAAAALLVAIDIVQSPLAQSLRVIHISRAKLSKLLELDDKQPI